MLRRVEQKRSPQLLNHFNITKFVTSCSGEFDSTHVILAPACGEMGSEARSLTAIRMQITRELPTNYRERDEGGGTEQNPVFSDTAEISA